MEILKLNSIEDRLPELTNLLIDCVDDGASIGFLPPLDDEEAQDYWRSVSLEMNSGAKEVFTAIEDGELLGSIQLALPMKPNASHRCEIQKLMVHTGARSRRIGRRLMRKIESRALELNRSLIVLDTRRGDVASDLYYKMGYIEFGNVPGYARSGDGRLHTSTFFYKQLV